MLLKWYIMLNIRNTVHPGKIVSLSIIRTQLRYYHVILITSLDNHTQSKIIAVRNTTKTLTHHWLSRSHASLLTTDSHHYQIFKFDHVSITSSFLFFHLFFRDRNISTRITNFSYNIIIIKMGKHTWTIQYINIREKNSNPVNTATRNHIYQI